MQSDAGSVTSAGEASPLEPGIDPVERWKRLPAPVRLEDTRAMHDAAPVPDPLAGRDTERDFMLRFAGM